jgi:diguanylate cyclase (GGDEF)-like protein
MLAHSSEGIVVAAATGPDYPVVYVNPAYERLNDCSADEVLGGCLPLLTGDGLDEDQLEELNVALADGDSFEAQLAGPCDARDSSVHQVRIEPLYGRRGPVKYVMLTEKPVPERERGASSVEVGVLQREISRARQKVASMDRIDPATGLLRHEYFLELAERDFRMARRDRCCVAILVLEIVELDVYGQTFGVKAAQSCLRMVAAQVNGALRRSGDLCARADGDSIVALTHGQEIEEIRALALRIAANVRGLGIHNPRARSGRYLTANVGVASGVPDGNYTPKEALTDAREDLWSQEPSQKPRFDVKA